MYVHSALQTSQGKRWLLLLLELVLQLQRLYTIDLVKLEKVKETITCSKLANPALCLCLWLPRGRRHQHHQLQLTAVLCSFSFWPPPFFRLWSDHSLLWLSAQLQPRLQMIPVFSTVNLLSGHTPIEWNEALGCTAADKKQCNHRQFANFLWRKTLLLLKNRTDHWTCAQRA